MSQRISVPLSELQPAPAPSGGRVRVPVSELSPAAKPESAPRSLDPNPLVRMGQWFNDRGALETAGGVGGSALGGVPGAMSGAGLMRTVRGISLKEKPEDIAAGAIGHASLEALPVVGKILKAGGRALVRRALPIAEKEAKEVGRVVMARDTTSEAAKKIGKNPTARGMRELTDRAIDAPGLKLSTTARKMGAEMDRLGRTRDNLVSDATARGQRISSQAVLDAGDALSAPGGAIRESFTSPATESGARSVVDRFRDRVTRDVPMSDAEIVDAIRSGAARDRSFQPTRQVIDDLTPEEADTIIRNSKFFGGGKDVPGADKAGRALRSELSRQLKDAAPGLSDVMSRQERIIPTSNVLDRALAGGNASAAPEMVASGKGVRSLAIVRAPKGLSFALGKSAARVGKPLDTPALSGAARALLMQLLQEQENQRR